MTLLRKLAWLFARRRREADLEAELRFHLEEEAAERETAGLAPAAARIAARRELGNFAAVQEQTRAAWSWRWIEELAQDLRYAAGVMAANRVFTGLAILSLALGIGANTAIFSFMEAVLLRSLPVADPQSLVMLRMHTQKAEMHGTDFHRGSFLDPGGGGFTNSTFSFPSFEVFHREDRFFSAVFGYQSAGSLNVAVRGEAEIATGEYVTGDYFRGLGISPAAGRLILPDDDRAGAPAVVVVSYAFAEKRFGGRAAAGQSLLVKNIPFTVIGVTPPEFSGADPGAAPELYFPLHANLLLDPDSRRIRAAQRYRDPGEEWLYILARLRPGVTPGMVQAALGPPFHEWMAAYNDRRNRDDLPTLRVEAGGAGLDSIRRQFSKPLYLLMTLVVLILALACANIANLLLARAAARRREMAVRLSIGAGRFRLIRQLLTESVLLAAAGGTAGVVLAFWGVRFLAMLLSDGPENVTIRADLNWHVLAAAIILSLLTGVAFGLAPALESTRGDLAASLKQSRAGEGRAHSFFRIGLGRGLIVSQVAIAVVILIATGLFVRTLSNLESIQVGFNRENVLTFALDARQAGYSGSEIVPLYEGLRRRFADIPGVRALSFSEMPLIGLGWAETSVAVPGSPRHMSCILSVGADFFATMQIPMLRGRPIDEHDRSGVAVVDENFVQSVLGGGNPIGRMVTLPSDTGNAGYQIVGVAANARYGKLHGEMSPVMYLAYSQALRGPVDYAVFELRTAGDPLTYVRAVRDIVRQTDPRLPLTAIKTQAALIDQTIAQQIALARLSTAFGLLALAIAAVGLYGAVSYNVARRSTEIGIRMALGASRRRVVWNVLREVLFLLCCGKSWS